MNILHRSIDRASYFWWGFGLMAVKYNLDRAIAWFGYHHQWFFWNYLKPNGLAGISAVPPSDQAFYLALLLTSLPFIVIGVILTLARLRSAALPLALSLLFFIPAVNLLFFITLSLVPARELTHAQPAKLQAWSWLPKSAWGSALVSTLIVGLAGGGLAYFSTSVLHNYGWGLFVALPFAMGLVTVLLYAGNEKRTLGSCLRVSILPMLVCGVCLLLAAVEGVICLLMAAPIGLLLSLLGGAVGYLIVGHRGQNISPALKLLLLIAVPLNMGMEKQAEEPPPLLSVTSSVIINAPPEAVWPNVVAFSPIPPERDWILRTGVAYPTQARIDGRGVGAIRHCIFSTGEFVEPIEVWNEPHRLAFSVAAQPEPIEELSPYPHLETPHLHGYLQSHHGELELTALPGGKTLLQGTTWYTDRIWPSRYWQVWSDLLIHDIHLRVLNHIKELSEKD